VVPDAEGNQVEGVLTSAIVMEQGKVAVCAVNTKDGRGIICRVPLSDAELAAWRQHPATFFGQISKNRKSETVLDLYDFFMDAYTKTPKAKLLEFLAGAPDIDKLAALNQVELASVYCERLAVNAFPIVEKNPNPQLQTVWRR
jgi:hypothetical protein